MLKNNPVIIISRTDRIGDLILSIPAIKRTRDMFPEAKIIILVRSYNYDIVRYLPYVNDIVKIDEYDKNDLIQKVKSYHPDIFIALFTNKNIGKLSRKGGASIRIGPLSKFHSYFSYNKGVFQKRSHSVKNEAEYNFDLIKKLDKKRFKQIHEIDSKIYYSEENKKNIQSFFAEQKINRNYKTIVIHPFSGKSSKNLKIEQYRKITQFVLNQKPNYNVIISCNNTKEKECLRFKEGIDSEYLYLFINKGSILDLAALIDTSDLFIGGSTGPTHIAGSLQKKIVAFYSKIKTQSTIRWGVFNNPNVKYIQPDNPCKRKFGCSKKCKFYDCFDRIDLFKVAKEIVQYLENSDKLM